MCGFVGILHWGRLGDAGGRTRSMAAAIQHRGPDGDGFWSDNDLALGFRRLAIVDLETGDQPMGNEDGTVQVVFNGEIYNHRPLRRELEAKGHRFATDHSDTEVLVHGYEEWGEGLLPRLNGMFAFAAWDAKTRRLMLARDRLGIKPLYLARRDDGTLVFGSEIRGILASDLVPALADETALFAYFQSQNVWRGRSMFRGIEQLEGGHLLLEEPGRHRRAQYWDMAFNRRARAPADAAAELRHVLEGALARQLAADVPVMAYLSGGIDSSSIVAGAHSIDPGVHAYSCIFQLDGVGEDRFVDEREFSRAVASDLGVAHVELELAPDALIGALHRTIDALEEPRMGMAYVNYLIAERVSRDTKVVLSGCGGDEILGGYVSRYAHLRLPYPVLPPSGRLDRFLRRFRRPPDGRDPGRRLLEMLRYPVPTHEIAEAFTAAFRRAAGEYDLAAAVESVTATCPSEDDWDRLMYLDSKTYLAGLLMVEDKLSMAHGLETRVPLLDNETIDLALTFDWPAMCDGETGKIVFRNAIRDWVPKLVADKPKMGFGPPDASWYRGALQPYIRRMLAPDRIAARGVFQAPYVAAAIESHMSGAANRVPLIWSLLSFDAWCEIHGFYGGDLNDPMRGLGARL